MGGTNIPTNLGIRGVGTERRSPAEPSVRGHLAARLDLAACRVVYLPPKETLDLLRLVVSMKFGHTTASLLIAKLHASSRQSTLAKALHEYGRLIRTLYVCRYVADKKLRRRVRRQLNKGESLHALRRDLFFAHQGHVRRRHLDDKIDQALCLTLVTNACVLWTTTYLGDTIDALRADGIEVGDETAAHLTPAQHDHINFYGTYSFDIDAELCRDGHRPLRIPA